MSVKRLALFLVVCSLAALAGARAVSAQEQAVLTLEIETADLQTGQEYWVTIQLDGAPSLWALNAEITYDPSMIYIIGTQSGQPVSRGELFSPPESTVIVRNTTRAGELTYTISMLAPADPIGGSGPVGAFRIYPLAPGTTELSFSRVEATTVTFSGTGDQRTASAPQPVPLTSQSLALTITGDPVTPPPEATATPEPTATPGRGPGQEGGLPEAPSPPTPTPEEQTSEAPPAEAPPSPPSLALQIAAVVTVVAGAGLVALIVVWRRRSAR